MEDQRYSQERKEGLAMDAVAAPMPENSMMDTSKSEQSEQSESSTAGHLTGFTLGITLLALCIATFCVALDNTIISTAIPAITDEFHALQDVGWYGSAYLLTTCALQLPFGKLYGLFSAKWTFLSALFLFELGSLICAVARSSPTFIGGRALAGVGAAGVFSGSLVIIARSTPIEKRPVYQSMLGSTFGIASIVGPLIGGAFTDLVTWRWCFYINLPLGGVTAIVIVFFLHTASMGNPFKTNGFWGLLWSLDPLGFVLFVPSIVSILIALQWGGSLYAWNDGRVIALLVVFAVALVAFVGVQIWLGESATIPPRVGSQRTVWSASIFSFFLSGAFFLLIYFLPIYFQAIKGTSALRSGIDSIPLILSNVVGIILAGGLTAKVGYYMPFIYLCVVFTSIASGLLTTLSPTTMTAKWVGYQILYGFGCGCGFQLPQIAAQAALPFADVQTGIAITLFFQNFGGALFVSAGNNVLNDQLVRRITALDIPGLEPKAVLQAGATGIRNIIPAGFLDAVVNVYNDSLRLTFQVALILSALSAIGAVFMEWKNLKAPVPKGDGTETPQSSEKV
ncbi:major facilitator superfamily domain-containing protein [Nemania diffusa]|nr:major facilitator superfamily domain-containing protein [Nemania diffusa]